jgi:HAD superfamily hydrolase (TIGR01549 family)
VIIPSFIYFDLDNTLVDHDEALRVALRQLCMRMPGWLARRSFAEIHREFEAINGELWEAYGAGRITPEVLRRERSLRLASYCDPDGRSHPVDRITDEYVELYIASTRPVEWAVQTVATLAESYRLGIISNGFAQWQRRKLMIAGIDRYFESVVLSEDISSLKPDAAIFDAAVRIAGCNAGEIAVVGDSYSHDVIGASRSGMSTVWFNPRHSQAPYDNRGVEPDAEISSLRQLLELFPGTNSE